MPTRIACVVIAIALAVPLVAVAQPAAPAQQNISQPADLEMRVKRRRSVVLPVPPQQTVIEDVERATEEITARAREDRLIQERERRLSRPDLDSTISNGIAARNAERLLRR